MYQVPDWVYLAPSCRLRMPSRSALYRCFPFSDPVDEGLSTSRTLSVTWAVTKKGEVACRLDTLWLRWGLSRLDTHPDEPH
jgi:hypothetical protein